jgi:hypothetical protein
MDELEAEADAFFTSLAPFDDFAEVLNPAHYRAAPSSWLVVVTDVLGSTKAIEAGRYKDVNSLGVASIVALRNALGGMEVPFVFGGDGATLLVPGRARSRVEATLRGVRKMAREAFGMEMRAAIVGVDELTGRGHEVRVARHRTSEHVAFAMFRGSGLTHAERLVKDPTTAARYAVSDEGEAAADFTGFECRWEPIPSQRGTVASLLIQARAPDVGAGDRTYRRVLTELQSLLESSGCPVSEDRLVLQRFGGDFEAEAKIRGGSSSLGRGLRRMRARFDAFAGTVLMKNGWKAGGFPGATYKQEVVANTDFRKFDETLRLVVDVEPATLGAIEELLKDGQRDGDLAYGMHLSSASLMTCAIQAYEGKHVHFVDGADGGYALAAKQLKSQLGPK